MKKNFKNFLSGKIVDLVTIDKNFVENTDWFDWINFELNTEFLTVGNFPNTLSHQRKYFSELRRSWYYIDSNAAIFCEFG